jgi:hypothetical protein
MGFSSTIEQWFKDKWGGSLFLPDGWFGRPYDNQHSLTFIEESDDTLTLVLDKKLTLRFEGLKSVEKRNCQLVFVGYDKLWFEWKSFGEGDAGGAKLYKEGEAKIVAVPG